MTVDQVTGYDVIGDVHGHVDALEELLRRLGYSPSPQPEHPRCAVLWSHPDRQAIFVGDLIDRGPEQIRTVDLVRAMVDAGTAQMIVGNHEFNAVAWATPDPERPGEHLRPRTGELGEKNRSQHACFLDEIEQDSELYFEYIAWFRSLPLWLDLGGLRVVHASWDSAAMRVVSRFASAAHSLTHALVVEGSRKGSPEYVAIEILLKGPELDLPATHHYRDRDGHLRGKARVRWWQSGIRTLRDAAEMPPNATGSDGRALGPLPDDELDPAMFRRYDHEVPVVFGHYWRTPESTICTSTTVCVDYSVAKGGDLVAYRWTPGERTLDERNLVFASGNGPSVRT